MRCLIALHGTPLGIDPARPLTGNALRASGLARGLRAHGHETVFLTRAQDLPANAAGSAAGDVLGYDRPQDFATIAAHYPASVLICVTPEMLTYLPQDFNVPVVADLFAPRLAEALYEPIDFGAEFLRWGEALRRADFFLCTNARARYFYLPWLMLAGFDIRDGLLGTVPLSAPVAPPRDGPGEETIVAGGVPWPWQDVRAPLRALAAALERIGRGELEVYGGAYPLAREAGTEHAPETVYPQAPRCSFKGMLAYPRLLERYSRARAAFNVAEPNPERELALSFRDMDYLACGLPVICAAHSVLAASIRAAGAGWVWDGTDADALTAIVAEAMGDPAAAARKGAAARHLAVTEFAAENTVAALAAFVAHPRRARRAESLWTTAVRVANESLKERLERVAEIQENAALRAKITEMGTELGAAGKARDEAQALGERLKFEVRELENQRAWAKAQMEQADARIRELAGERDSLRLRAEHLASQVDELHGKVRDQAWLPDEVSRLARERDALKDRVREIEVELTAIKASALYKVYKKVAG